MAVQARRRKKPAEPETRLPSLRLSWKMPVMFAAAAVAAWLVFEIAQLALQQPIRALEIQGSFQRVSALEVEAALSPGLDRGFFTADLGAMRASLEELPWVASATIRRRWPDTLQITVVEHVAAARWGETGLLNTRGELFVTDARHIPAELPRLHGPAASEAKVVAFYLDLRASLAAIGLRPASLMLDARGSWNLTLSNGVEVRLGRQDVDARVERFLIAARGELAIRMNEVRYVDMRYSNGFSVGWVTTHMLARGDEVSPHG